MKIIRSLNYESKQENIIKDILDLHNKGEDIELDLTYSKGIFYKSGLLNQPKYKVDLYTDGEDIIKCSFTDTPFEDNSISTIMFDPPFVISGKTYKESDDTSCLISKRFTCYYSWEELKESYKGAIEESYRILNDKGLLIVKCQNTISSGKQYFSHYYIMQEAIKLGFYPLDEFILPTKSKITSFGGRWKTQKHAMKYHSYFLVFRKNGKKINYN